MPNWRNPEFDWDDGNVEHILDRHGIDIDEVEQVFRNHARVIKQGDRYVARGQDDAGRYLFVVCEIRFGRVRVITARPMRDAEKRGYERQR